MLASMIEEGTGIARIPIGSGEQEIVKANGKYLVKRAKKFDYN
jgi:hypothetical protein